MDFIHPSISYCVQQAHSVCTQVALPMMYFILEQNNSFISAFGWNKTGIRHDCRVAFCCSLCVKLLRAIPGCLDPSMLPHLHLRKMLLTYIITDLDTTLFSTYFSPMELWCLWTQCENKCPYGDPSNDDRLDRITHIFLQGLFS